MANPAEFFYTYRDLGRLSGLRLNTISQHVRRGNLDPGALESVVLWLSRHGSLDLRQRMLCAALVREVEPKAKRRRKSRK
jgi:hypothetical protein